MINVIYFGTSDHSVILLTSLLKNNEVKLNLVVTKPDKPVGRKASLSPTPVKKWCMENNIPFITPASLKKEKDGVLAKLTEVYEKSNFLGLVADYGLIIPPELIVFFKNGLINIHFSLLPKYRGASPVTYTILHGDTKTGITFLLTNEEMDKGNIIKQIAYEITEKETDETLYKKLFQIAGIEVFEVLKGYLAGKLPPQKQDEAQATYATPSGKFDRTTYISKEDAEIDWTKSPKEIEQAVRAYFPWPVAWTTLGDLSQYLNLKLRNPEHSNLKLKILKVGLGVVDNLVFDQVQVEGKDKCDFASFINGYFVKKSI